MRVRLRDRQPEPLERRTVRVQDTALWRGALIELSRMEGEIARLRALLAKHSIEDPGAS